jgi:hypothetical protein
MLVLITLHKSHTFVFITLLMLRMVVVTILLMYLCYIWLLFFCLYISYAEKCTLFYVI